MTIEITAPVSLEALASKLGVASQRSPVKIERSSSPAPLIDGTSDIPEDGEIGKQQFKVGSLQGELQLANLEYSALEDRYKRLERQHSELQDLASAYSEVIRGFSVIDQPTVCIDQLQAEAGRDGLRAKALEADVLRPLVRESGGLQALISQINIMRNIIDKAGGLQELEQFVSDLRTIRDTIDELRGSRGLVGLAAEVRDLLQSKQKQDRLAAEVNGPNGLREKAAKYEKLAKTFADVQNTSKLQWRSASNAAMNPARARMISATPLEVDPDRDLYEAPPPVAKPNNRTGSNNTPLGASQDQPSESSLKRKGPETSASTMPAKRPRIDVGRASTLLHASLPTTVGSSADRIAGPKNPSGKRAGTAGVKVRNQAVSVHATDSLLCQSKTTDKEGQTSSLKARLDASQAESGSAKTNTVGSRPQVNTAPLPPRMPDWMRADVCYGDVGFASAAGAPRYSSTPPTQDAEHHTDARQRPVRFSTAVAHPPAFCSLGDASGAYTALQAVAAVPADPHPSQMTIWKDYLRHAVAFWVGSSDASAAWDAYQLYDLKRNFQIPGDLLTSLTGELSRLIPVAKYSVYETMAPSHDTCILR
ncbi:uncharacterized protein M421DRAFT_2245 [Didymella exigua CBS 183.55]|uniref:Uncharacterized protein n=1 Tax=Didymella exigua CBS 183.55 TaxID=1150837 RepID=A0A6A5S228_9PLEO|nr:uncharacterized protein M421DRAFT_2245 [Didymella exigua CBS 183.55]KAF1931587.1 hypothetical protein M421DRAFT_2245 [Didymella exigua CBS 183.55]